MASLAAYATHAPCLQLANLISSLLQNMVGRAAIQLCDDLGVVYSLLSTLTGHFA
jgi:hypothetical protein